MMAKLYYDLIKKGLKTLEDVPTLWRDEVAALLEADEADEIIGEEAPHD